MMWKRTIASTVVLGLALPLLPAQEASRASLPEFHEVHVNTIEIECTDCHALPDDPAPGMELSFTVRPGHDQCNICHEDEFDEGEFIALCLTCHTNDFFELGNFPSGNDSIGDFSHERHVDPRGRVDRVSGQRLDCVFCHQVAGDGGAGLPSHPQCKDCHAGSGAAPPVISPDDNQACLGCHALARIDYTIKHRPGEMEAAGMLPAWLKAKLLAAPAAAEDHEDPRGPTWSDVVKFPHDKHVQERTGEAINCMVCHQGVLTRAGVTDSVTYPGMNECAVCHNQATRVGSENTMDECKICHTVIDEATVPGHKGHLTSIAHTPSFFVNHQAQAREEEGYCTYCHGLDLAAPNGCDECHSVLQPKNHRAARFSETTHGRLAAMDRENCAVCHQSDFCIRCHSIPPRSHAPLPIFASGGHRLLAAINLRSCFACHTFEDACLECHEPELRTPGG